MAEFVEVMKQAKRMCIMHNTSCTGCPLANDKDMCMLLGCRAAGVLPEEFDLAMLAKVERIIMDWAEKQPEPRYPTWKEWQDMNFPNNDALMRPCIFESEEYFNCKQEIGCEKCMNNPIPADIAEKLHIKPIGVKDDA